MYTIFDPFKREKSVLKIDYLSQDGLLNFVYTNANPGIEDIVVVPLFIPTELWILT